MACIAAGTRYESQSHRRRCTTIQAILRHSNVSTTLSFYVKNSSGDSVAALQRLERAMGNEWATIAVAGGAKC
jgi:hypothetical protein